MIKIILNGAALVAVAAMVGSCGAPSDLALDGGGGNPGSGAVVKPFQVTKAYLVQDAAGKPQCVRLKVSRNLDSEVVLGRLAFGYFAEAAPVPMPIPPTGDLPAYYGGELSCDEKNPTKPGCSRSTFDADATIETLCVKFATGNHAGANFCGSTPKVGDQLRLVYDWKGKVENKSHVLGEYIKITAPPPPSGEKPRACFSPQ